MVPPFSDIFKIEVKIRDLKDLNMLLINQNQKDYFCMPQKYKDMTTFEETLKEYEEELI